MGSPEVSGVDLEPVLGEPLDHGGTDHDSKAAGLGTVCLKAVADCVDECGDLVILEAAIRWMCLRVLLRVRQGVLVPVVPR